MLKTEIDRIRSEAAMQGWLGGSVDKIYALAKAKMEQKHLEKSKALRADIASRQTQLGRLQNRSASAREHLTALLAEKNLNAPFEWMLGRGQLAFLTRKTRKLEKLLGRATDELEQLREWSASRIAELESEVQLAYEQGQSFRELTGGIIGSNNNLILREEAYDEI